MNQDQLILQYLKSGKSLTALEALSAFGCLRLAARIEELWASGYEIETEFLKTNGKRYAKYKLSGVPVSSPICPRSNRELHSESAGWEGWASEEVPKTRLPGTNPQLLMFENNLGHWA